MIRPAALSPGLLERRRTRALPNQERRIAAELLLGTAATLALLANVQGLDGLWMLGLAGFVAGSMLLVVQAPIGSVPLGYALVIALAELCPVQLYFTIVGIGLLSTVPVLAARYGHADTGKRLLRWVVAGCAAAVVAIVVRLAVPGTDPAATLLHVSLAGVAFLGVELYVRRALPTTTAPAIRLSEAWPVEVTILCAGALLAVGYRQEGAWTALIAVVPLILTRFAYDRYAAARQAYRQTIKALSIVPEVAGVTPLGHGERTAAYTVAIARKLGMSNAVVDRLATAARLHHIGYVTLDDPRDLDNGHDLRLLSRLGGDILRETQFLADVGDLVEGVHAEDVRFHTSEVAVLRVAGEFDHLVLEDPARAHGALALLGQHRDVYDAAALLALRWLVEEDADFVRRAIATGAPLTEAVGGHG